MHGAIPDVIKLIQLFEKSVVDNVNVFRHENDLPFA